MTAAWRVLSLHHVAVARGDDATGEAFFASLLGSPPHTEKAPGFVERMYPTGDAFLQTLEADGDGVVQRFLDKHGPRAILIGRFIGIVRAVAPFLYGSSGMKLRTFLPWSILGTGIWATAFTLVGYIFSESFEKAADTLAHGALAFAAIVAAGLLIRAYLQHRRAKALA